MKRKYDNVSKYGSGDDEFKATRNCPYCGSEKLYKVPWLEMDRHLHEEDEILLRCDFCNKEHTRKDD